MGVLIDTTVLVSLERGGRLSDDFLDGLEPSTDFAIAAITASELLVGLERADRENRRSVRSTFIERALERLLVLPFDLEIAKVHARIWASLSSRGQVIGPYDLLIAATALGHNLDLMTENIREFERVPGLQTIRPGWDV